MARVLGGTELEGRERRRVELEPEVLALAVGGDDGLSGERGLEVGGGDAVDDLGVVGDHGLRDPLAEAVLLYGSPSRLHLRKLRHSELRSTAATVVVPYETIGCV